MVAVGTEIPPQQRGTVGALEDDRPAAVGEQYGCAPVGPVGEGRQRVGADEQYPLGTARGVDHGARGDEPVGEAGAGRVQVERTAAEPQLGVDDRRSPRHALVGRGGGQDQQVDIGGLHAGHLHGGPAGLDAHGGGGQADAALADPGALPDPLVAGVHHRGQVVVGEDLLR